MHLEHINLVVLDLAKSLKFYQAAFPHWQVRGSGTGDWYGKPRTWLHFGDNEQYIALSDHGEGQNRNLKGTQVGLAHFAYVCDDLKGLIQRLQKANFSPHIGPTFAENRSNVYYLDADGFEVEFVQYHSDDPSIRNDYTSYISG